MKNEYEPVKREPFSQPSAEALIMAEALSTGSLIFIFHLKERNSWDIFDSVLIFFFAAASISLIVIRCR